ncbi:hypothetical protein [Vreelandella populi]|uniref:Uncharacterized protein n=1 Tax=Vreelandella populi TaxID=2498858 RepID=A0A3S0WQL4_9GAMM|nr:hypothetical protein [Halomonas populi]RUR49414.1 hypothetical protein ELY37_01565 [Halomonas populi]
MKIGFSNLMMINTRREPSSGLSAARVTGQPLSVAAPNTDDPQTKRLKKQKEAFEALASLPSPKESAMQNASQKVGFLKQRLESLKAMMRFASPEQLKSMASELKSIARELGVAARQLSGGGTSTAGPTVSPTVNAAQPANNVSEVPSTDSAQSVGSDSNAQGADTALASAEAAISAEMDDELKEQEQSLNSDDAIEKVAGEALAFANVSQRDDNRSTTVSASEHALRSILTDARKELQEAINELKMRLREEDKEARREPKKAEEDMAKLDRSLAQSTSNALYSALGQMLPGATSDASSAAATIDVEA